MKDRRNNGGRAAWEMLMVCIWASVILAPFS